VEPSTPSCRRTSRWNGRSSLTPNRPQRSSSLTGELRFCSCTVSICARPCISFCFWSCAWCAAIFGVTPDANAPVLMAIEQLHQRLLTSPCNAWPRRAIIKSKHAGALLACPRKIDRLLALIRSLGSGTQGRGGCGRRKHCLSSTELHVQNFFSLFFSNSYRIWTRRRAVSCTFQRCRIAPAVGRADKHSGVRKAVRPLLHPGNCWNHTEITWIILVSPTASDLTRRGGRMAHAVLSWPRERPTRLRGQNKAHAHRTPQNTAVFDACTFACACTCTLRVHVSRAARTPGNPTESAARRASPLYSACRGR